MTPPGGDPSVALPDVGGPDDPFNIAAFLPAQARRRPYQQAVVFPEDRTPAGRRKYSHLTYEQLEADSNRCAAALRAAGVERGMRTLLMVRPSPAFVSLTFALFKLGAVPILIDPGMGRRNLLSSIEAVSPRALVAIPLAHAARVRFPGAFRSVEVAVTVGRRWLWGGHTLDGLLREQPTTVDLTPAPTRGGDPAAILYTTGSTGPPKGVAYTHGMFGAQVAAIRAHYGIEAGETDLPCFPLFVLFSVALGVTSVIPDMDPTRPAQCDPALLVEAIRDHGVTYSFGSPAIWSRVGPWCAERGVTLPSVRRVLMAGAPVPERVVRPMLDALPNGDVHTPYGATESLPVTSFSGRQALAETFARTATGAGVCVGAPLPGIELVIIRPVDGPIARWDDVAPLPTGEIGEICVRGAVVTREYADLPEATAKAKIAAGETIWHRIGDVGYLDEQGRLWFCGRAAHRVRAAHGPMYTVPCEAIANAHPQVFRSALVGVGEPGAQRPVLCLELEPDAAPSAALTREVRERLDAHAHTRPIEQILVHPAFPVDIRHNAKIFREQLAVWAAAQPAVTGGAPA